VCTDDDPTSSLWGHLYKNGGAVNKIVPASLQARVVRRDGSPEPIVKAVAIDTDFDSVDWSNGGKVNIAIQGGITQGTPTTTPVPGSRRACAPLVHPPSLKPPDLARACNLPKQKVQGQGTKKFYKGFDLTTNMCSLN
jgi:hypothetical protein